MIAKQIEFEEQKKFDWLGNLSLDFYLPKYNVAIECQGKQHFGLGGWSKSFNFIKQNERDKLKNELCNKNGVEILYFTDLKPHQAPNDYFGKILFNNDALLNFFEYLLLN